LNFRFYNKNFLWYKLIQLWASPVVSLTSGFGFSMKHSQTATLFLQLLCSAADVFNKNLFVGLDTIINDAYKEKKHR
jgi:hypothetical protein